MKSHWRGRLAAVLTAVVAATLVSAPTAQAAGETTVAWTHTYNYDPIGHLVSSSAGVTASSCMLPYQLAPTAAITYASNGAAVGSVVPLGNETASCNWEISTLVDKAGNSYIDAGGNRWSTQHAAKIYSFTKEGVSRWAQPATLPQLCPGDDGDRWLESRTLGADGHLYGIARTGMCVGDAQYRLVSFNAANGSLRFSVPLSPYELRDPTTLHAYKSGLAVYYYAGVRYFNYNGVALTTTPYYEPISNSVFPFPGGSNAMAVGVEGNSLLLTATHDDSCQWGYRLKGLDSYMSWGHEWRAELSQCAYSAKVAVTPDRGAVLFTVVPSTTNPAGSETVIHRFNNYGNHQRVRWSTTLYATTVAKQFWSEQDKFIGVDVNGNVLVQRYYLDGQEGGLNHFQIVKLSDGAGTPSVIADTADSGKPGTFYEAGSVMLPAMGNGQVYAAYGHVCNGEPGCSVNDMMLFAFSTPDVGLDYPRGALQNTQPVPAAVSFQALGDSYIVGEGDDTEGFVVERGKCHLSNTAWPLRAAGDTRLNLALTAFPACSGATAVQMMNGGAKPKQIDKISSGAKVYAVSAGGNDIGFPQLITTCILLSCNALESQIMTRINGLGTQLTPLYNALKQKAGSTGDIYVMAYPRVLPNAQCSTAPLGTEALSRLILTPAIKPLVAEWLTSVNVSVADVVSAANARNFTFSATEAAAATRLTNALNAKIEAIVRARNDPKFHFVKANYTGGPFENRTLCSASPAFNGIVTTYSDLTALVGNLMMSFHPNNGGTAAYKKMFLDCRLSRLNCV